MDPFFKFFLSLIISFLITKLAFNLNLIGLKHKDMEKQYFLITMIIFTIILNIIF